MKKITITLMSLFVAAAAWAGDYSHDANILPQAAKSVIQKNFKAEVSVIKIDKTLGKINEYEVVLTDGSEITFDSKGNWKEVETSKKKSVPAGFVPKPVSDYVAKNHKGQKIVGIEIKHDGYEVDLSNGIDIKFDKSGNFVKYD